MKGAKRRAKSNTGAARAAGSNNQPDDIEGELSCPVCFELFKDPCFVCPNHHTLCRGCYQAISARSSDSDAARCPECRERLLPRSVENSRMRGLVQAHRQTGRQPSQATCQATGDGGRCQRRAFEQCGHCDRSLCDFHFSKDRLEFQSSCEKLLLAADEAAKEANADKISRAAWNRLIDDCIQLLQSWRRSFAGPVVELKSETALRVEATALRCAINSGDTRVVKTAFDRLSAAEQLMRQQLPHTPPPNKTVALLWMRWSCSAMFNSHLLGSGMFRCICSLRRCLRRCYDGCSERFLNWLEKRLRQ